MKREIKFRAWLKSESKMCDISLINFERGSFLEGAEPSADQYFDNGRFVVRALPNGRFCNLGEYEIMQFTGLLDKNGKEVYEGDIFRMNNMLFVVEFHNSSFLGKALENNYNYSEGKHYSFYPYSDTEVIGNIYETPELL